MSSIGDELAALIGELAAVGIPATVDPDMVLPTVAETGLVALVGPPETVLPYLSGAEVQATMPVFLAGNPPGGRAQWEPIWAAQPDAMRVCASEARPQALTVGDLALPAVRLTAQRTFIAAELKRS